MTLKFLFGFMGMCAFVMIMIDCNTDWEHSSKVNVPAVITPTVEATATLTPTFTATPTFTVTPAPEPTETPRISVNTATPTPSLTPTKTAVSTPSDTPVPTAVPETNEAIQLIEYHNQARILAGIEPLIWDPQLAIAAEYRTRDMAAKGYFSHTAPDGKSWEYLLNQMKYPHGWAGENIHYNRGFLASNQAEVTHKGYMNSPGHKENILRPQFTHVGTAFTKDENGAYYNAVIFAEKK